MQVLFQKHYSQLQGRVVCSCRVTGSTAIGSGRVGSQVKNPDPVPSMAAGHCHASNLDCVHFNSSTSNGLTDGRTDRQTDDLAYHYRAMTSVHRAVKTEHKFAAKTLEISSRWKYYTAIRIFK